MSKSHLTAVFQALLVTFLWSTSWVLIKIGLQDIPALTFAGLRYTLAFICLVPFALRARNHTPISTLSKRDWLRLIALGLLFYTVTQGAQFLGLFYLPAITTNLLLSFTTIIVALLGIAVLAERPTFLQWGGVGLYLIGAMLFFYPAQLPRGQIIGFVIVTIGVLANASSALLGRSINREAKLAPISITVITMGIGGFVLLFLGLTIQGFPPLSLINWAFILWLAVVNTAFAFTLWNVTLRTLSAMESSIINNAMMIQIPLLAWLFLGESITWQKGISLVLAGLGILIVQIPHRK